MAKYFGFGFFSRARKRPRSCEEVFRSWEGREERRRLYLLSLAFLEEEREHMP
jgi:hypothetical protein